MMIAGLFLCHFWLLQPSSIFHEHILVHHVVPLVQIKWSHTTKFLDLCFSPFVSVGGQFFPSWARGKTVSHTPHYYRQFHYSIIHEFHEQPSEQTDEQT